MARTMTPLKLVGTWGLLAAYIGVIQGFFPPPGGLLSGDEPWVNSLVVLVVGLPFVAKFFRIWPRGAFWPRVISIAAHLAFWIWVVQYFGPLLKANVQPTTLIRCIYYSALYFPVFGVTSCLGFLWESGPPDATGSGRECGRS